MRLIGVYKKQLGLVLVTVTVLTIMGVFIHLSLQDRESYRWVTHSYEVQARLGTTLLDIETGQDAHEEYRLDGDPEALVAFNTAFQKAFVDLDALQA